MLQTRYFPLLTALTMVGLSATSCSGPGKPAEANAGAPDTSKTPKIADSGARADSLNGIPGHPFGSSITTFPGLQLLNNENGYKRYTDGFDPRSKKPQPVGWFGKHANELADFYYFHNDKFVMFQSMAEGPSKAVLLNNEAAYLFGARAAESSGGTRWQGAHVSVVLADAPVGTRGEIDHILTVSDFVTADAIAKETADLASAALKKENAQ